MGEKKPAVKGGNKTRRTHMKNRVSALIIAVGMAAAPLSARPSSNHQSKTDVGSNLQKRVASTLKRLCRKKAEQDFIRESNEEITNALNAFISNQQDVRKETVRKAVPKVILATTMPKEGIDISEEFKQLQGKSKSS
jgi:hypothetical protein